MAIEYLLSEEIDSVDVGRSPSFSSLPVRISKYNAIAEEVSRDFVQQWKYASNDENFNSSANQSPVGHLASLFFPECPPDRLRVVTKLLDYITLEDDFLGPGTSSIDTNTELAKENSPMHSSSNTEIKKIQRSMIEEGVATCGQAMLAFLECATKYWKARKDMPGSFESLEEYIPLRVVHSSVFLFDEVAWVAMDIKLEAAEKESVTHIVKPLGEELALLNDYYSYPMEKREQSTGPIHNAVVVLMQQHAISEKEALARLRSRIIEAEEEHCAAFDIFARNDPPEKLMWYIVLYRMAVAGCHYWHPYATRYGWFETNGAS